MDVSLRWVKRISSYVCAGDTWGVNFGGYEHTARCGLKYDNCSATSRNLCLEAKSRDLGGSATCDGSSANVHTYAGTRAKTQERAQVRAVKMNL
jgi:hypothetical protein